MKFQMMAALAVVMSCGVALAQEKPAPDKPATKQPDTRPATTGEKPAQEKLQYVKFETTEGSFVLELNHEKAPVSVENFVRYVEKGFYDGTIFHRVMPDFMIQGGGMDEKGNYKKTDAPIVNEHSNGLKNKRGTISMARTANPNSATSQFFINVADNDGTGQYNLDSGAGYAVFGKVVQGMDTVDKIKDGETDYRGQEKSLPKNPVKVTKATKLTKDEADKIVQAGKDVKPSDKKDAPRPEPKPESKQDTKSPEKKK
ncbi:MAG TPA: peptidylprolyl isomerase [Phycisphaerales bacterium]|nr:peptidylprolyl isomerase [Phycisphaerales bacterium]